MYVPDELKINRFQKVNLPKNRDYFARYGNFIPASTYYTGDEVAPMPSNKIDSIEDLEAYDKLMQEKYGNDA